MTGIAIKPGVAIKPGSALQSFPRLMLSLDAATFEVVTTTGAQALGTGTSSGFFRVYGVLHPDQRFDRIKPGWTVVDHPTWVVVSNTPDPTDNNESCTIVILGGAFVSGQFYAFTSANTWYDSIAQRPFLLHNGVSYDSDNGGSLVFSTTNHQYADTPTSLDELPRWTVEAWYYYDGTNIGSSPCIVTEVYDSTPINYALGNCSDSSPDIQTGNWNGSTWHATENGHQLTAGNWYHLVGTHDGKQHKLYINNSLVSTVPAPSLGQSSGLGIRLMNRWDSGQTELQGGKLAVVNIYNGDIGAAGVAARWNANNERFGLNISYTIQASDFTEYAYGYNQIDQTSTSGYTANAGATLGDGFLLYTPTGGIMTTIANAWSAAGLDPNKAYVWRATWASYTPPGESPISNYECLVRTSYGNTNTPGSPNATLIITIDQNDTRWQAGTVGNSALRGEFTMPVTLSAYTPVTELSGVANWC